MTPSVTIPHMSAREAMRLVTRTELAREYLHVKPDGLRIRVLWRALPLTLEDGYWKVRLGKACEIYDRMTADGTLDKLIRELTLKMTRDGITGEPLSPGGRRAPEPVTRGDWTSPVQPARQGAMTLETLFDGWEK